MRSANFGSAFSMCSRPAARIARSRTSGSSSASASSTAEDTSLSRPPSSLSTVIAELRTSDGCSSDRSLTSLATAICMVSFPRSARSGTPLSYERKAHGRANLGENLIDDVPMHVGKAAIDAVVTPRQFGVVNAHQMQNGRVEVVTPDWLLRTPGPFVALAMRHARFHSGAAKPRYKGPHVVIAAVLILAERLAAKFSRPDD